MVLVDFCFDGFCLCVVVKCEYCLLWLVWCGYCGYWFEGGVCWLGWFVGVGWVFVRCGWCDGCDVVSVVMRCGGGRFVFGVVVVGGV